MYSTNLIVTEAHQYREIINFNFKIFVYKQTNSEWTVTIFKLQANRKGNRQKITHNFRAGAFDYFGKKISEKILLCIFSPGTSKLKIKSIPS